MCGIYSSLRIPDLLWLINIIVGQYICCSVGAEEKEWLSSLGKYASMCFQADVYRTIVDKS